MSYTVSVCAGLVGNEVRYLQDVEGSTPLASILNLSGQLRPCPKAWLTENVLVHGASTYSLQQLIEERITLHDIGTLENSQKLFFTIVAQPLAPSEIHHTPRRFHYYTEFGAFCEEWAPALPALLQPAALVATRGRQAYTLPADVEILPVRALLMAAVQAEASDLLDLHAERTSRGERRFRYALHEPQHSLFDRAVRAHAPFLGALEGRFLQRKARAAISSEVQKWLTCWGRSEERQRLIDLLDVAISQSKGLGFFF